MIEDAGLPDPYPIEPVTRPFDLSIVPPGSKSITCRAYLLAALAEGRSRLVAPLRSDDTDRLLGAMETLGAASSWDGDDVEVEGVGGRFSGGGDLDLGDGGAPSRFTLAAACLAARPVTIDGSPRLRERPIDQLVGFLRELGAEVTYMERDLRLPLRVTPAAMRGGALRIPSTLSSQFISALLLIGAALPEGLRLHYADPITSSGYVALTRRVMLDWGIDVRHGMEPCTAGAHAVLQGPIKGRRFVVEPDASSAVYWWTAAMLVPGAVLRTPGLTRSSPQPDVHFLDRFYPSADVPEGCWGADGAVVGHDTASSLAGTVDAADVPDAAMALAILAARSEAPVRITGLRTLRVKESDRIDALATELRRVGCTVETEPDAITIDPTTAHDEPVVIETHRDHRVAMAFAILGLVRPRLSIRDPGCVGKSYPRFWSDLGRLRGGS